MKHDSGTKFEAHDVEDICMDSDDVAALPKILQGLDDLKAGRSKPAEEVFAELRARYRAML